ncbi:MAG: hypothetical protein M1836_005509 [Candelina mexicana]|nr:MAG: hypothetical protein M1836_005509 [Candelina mexicana]
MLVDIHLPFYPSALNGITWSRDGELAIAAGEHVYVLNPTLLAPRAPPQSRSIKNAQWVIVRQQINKFTLDEIGILEPADSKTLSLGEEQSTSTVVSLIWSPPGLGKHRRSVLAVLTSNNVLSIWETYPNETKKWNRSLIINNAIAKYFEGLYDLIEESEAQQYHVTRLRRRIRAFSWSLPCHPRTIPGSESPCDVWGVPILAVTNDNNEIIFIQLKSPYYPLSFRGKQWRADVLGHVQVTQNPTDGPLSNSLLAISSRPVRFVSHIAWSPWVRRSDGAEEAVLVYLLGARLLFRKVRVQLPVDQTPSLSMCATLSLDTGKSEYFSDTSHHRLTGPLLSFEQVYQDGVLFAAATQSSIVTIFVRTSFSEDSLDGTSSPVSASWPVPGIAGEARLSPSIVIESRDFGEVHWDRISCIIFEHDITRLGVHIHIISQMTHTESFLYTVKGDKASIERLPESRLGKQLAESRSGYYVKYNFDGHTVSKFGGASLSPMGGYVATSFSVHAGDMPEYVTVAKEDSTITFMEFPGEANNANIDQSSVEFMSLWGVTQRWTSRIDDVLESLQGELHLSPPSNSRVSAEALVFKFLHCTYDTANIVGGNTFHGDRSHELRALNKLKEGLRQRLEEKTSSEINGKDREDSDGKDREPSFKSNMATQSSVCSRLRERVMLGDEPTALRLMSLLDRTASLEIIAPPRKASKAFDLSVSSLNRFSRGLLCLLIESILEIPIKWARNSVLNKKIKYSAACAALLGLCWSKRRLELINRTLGWLAADEGVEFREEREHLTWLHDSKSQASAFEYYEAHQQSHTLLSRSLDELQSSNRHEFFEVCRICGAGIGWDSLAEARCHSGHIFRRCALTFLAIQEPGISKYCGLCGVEYFHQDFVLKYLQKSVSASVFTERGDGSNGNTTSEVEEEAGVIEDSAQDADNAGTPVSFVQILLASYEVCVYCGGKFVG